MTGIDNDTSWMNNNKDTSNISINIKKHIKHGRHRAKYNFSHDPVSVKFELCLLFFYKLYIQF